MTSNQFMKGLVLVVVLGYLFAFDSSEARGWSDQQQDAILRQQLSDIQAQYGNIQNGFPNGMKSPTAGDGGDDSSNLDRLDSDEDDDEDERVQQQLQPASLPIQQLGSQLYQTGQQHPGMAGSQQQPSGEDLGTAASKHYGHHKHGAKGWLDMGAWTGKKGAFGWYDKHPVGKGK